MDQAAEYIERLKDTRLYRFIIVAALIGVAAYFFTGYVITGILVIGVGVVSWTVNRLGMKQVGVELATLSTVVIGVAYGPIPGSLMGLALIMLQMTAGQYTGSYIVWVIPAYPVAGFIAGTFNGVGIFVLGAGLTAGMQALFAVMTAVTVAGNFPRYFPYAATNVVFNLTMFMYVAPVILPLMT